MTQSMTTAQEDRAQGTAKLVTVHGTGAGQEANAGEQWWQLGSPFQEELAKRLQLDPARVEIVPFQWADGPNRGFLQVPAKRYISNSILE